MPPTHDTSSLNPLRCKHIALFKYYKFNVNDDL